MGLRKKLRKANLKDFKRGKAKLIRKTPDAVKYLAAPVYLPARATLEAAEIFGSTVEAVRPALKHSKGKSTTARATLAGVAGSVGFFTSAGKTAVKTGKAAFEAVPAPVKKVVGPVAGLVAGVVAVPVAARYLAPSAAVNAGQAAVAGTAKGAVSLVTPDGTKPQDQRGVQSAVPSGEAGTAATAVSGGAAASGVGGPSGTESARPSDAKTSDDRRPADRRRSASRARAKPDADRKRTRRSKGSRRKLDGDGAAVVAPASRRSRRRRGSGRRSGSLRGVSAQEAKLVQALEEGGWEVTLSPRG